jgi:hypothetical protein
MFAIHNFALFLGAAILLDLILDPDTTSVLVRSVVPGREGDIVSVLRISVGTIFHTISAAKLIEERGDAASTPRTRQMRHLSNNQDLFPITVIAPVREIRSEGGTNT